MLQNDRTIKICAAGSRFATRWPIQEYTLQDFYAKLSVPVRSSETRSAYLAMKKRQQDDLKDVGGFVGGVLRNGIRKAGNVVGRDLITLDIDRVAAGGTGDVLRRLSGLTCGWAAYSTRKHGPEAPRLRAIIPVDKTLASDEYEPAARKLASLIDPSMELFDPTTFQAVRLMYWPSCCSDAEYIFEYEDNPLLSTDGLLAMYSDWKNAAEWPQASGAAEALHQAAEKAEDPTSKRGVIGAFCRVYDIYSAMDTFLPGVYEQVDNSDDRFTFIGGSTTGGAVIYENGKYLYSHHATDPAGGRLCNAFDLVRLHRFGSQDDDAKPQTPPNKLPSYVLMCQLAVADASVSGLLNQERYQDMAADFGTPAETPPDDGEWMRKLELNSQGMPVKTLKNYKTIIACDPRLTGKIRLNLFTGRVDVYGVLPWERPGDAPLWNDTDTTNLRIYFEKLCGKTPKNDISDAVEACAGLCAYHPVRDYLNSLQWDGVLRLDTLWIDYLGAENTLYVRAVTRKSHVAAAARVLVPGIKYDTMPVLIGEQGRHKSSILSKMAGAWFSDSLKSFEGKEAMETIQGTWMNEIGEMQAFQRSEISAVKAFLSKQSDYYRAAYGRYAVDRARQCVFFGSSNTRDVLTDVTGGRRFWPIDIDKRERTKNVFVHLDGERDQLWAEAVVRWRMGESLILPPELDDEARIEQESHRERHPWEGAIEQFLALSVPTDWSGWDIDQRRMFLGGHYHGDATLTPRTRVCAAEVWCEMLGKSKADMNQRVTREINQLLERASGWKSTGNARFAGAPYGKQRCFEKIITG